MQKHRKIVLASRIPPFLKNLDLSLISSKTEFTLRYKSNYGESDETVKTRYNIQENVDYSITKIHEFGFKRMIVIKEESNKAIQRFMDLQLLSKVFNVLIIESGSCKRGVDVISNWSRI